MPNICVLVGTGYFGEDVWMKSPWIKELSSDIHTFTVSRIDPDVHFHKYLRKLIGEKSYNSLKSSYHNTKENSKDFQCVYPSKNLKDPTDELNFEEIQDWLGYSLNYLASFDRRFYDTNKIVDKRNPILLKNYLTELTYFFREYFTNNNIEYYINTIEDDTFSVLAFYVAKRLGIKIIGLMPSRFPKKGLMFCENFNNLLVWKDNNENINIKSMRLGSEISGKNILNKNKEYWSLSSSTKRFKGLSYIKNYKKYSSYLNEIYPYEQFTFERRTISSSIMDFFTKLYRKNVIKNIIQNPNLSNKYFIFPLHYTEDAQITFREPLINQFEIIRDISRVTPEGYFIYVKPHPHYFGTDLPLKELNSLSKLDNVEIINPYFNFQELMINSKGVITINSTTGFEALSLGLPVMTWGHDFYCKEELCYLIRDKNELAEKMMFMITNSKEKEKINSFMIDVYNNTIWIEGKETNLGINRLTADDGKAVALAIEKIIIKE